MTWDLQASLSSENRPGRLHGLKAMLAQHWADHCALIRHADQAPLRFEKENLRKEFKAAPCLAAGFCICGKAPERNRCALWFHDNIVRIFKSSLSQKSFERTLLEQSRLIIGLEAQAASAEDGSASRDFTGSAAAQHHAT